MPHSGARKRQRDALRERMLADGRTRQAIAEEMMRRWGYRPRTAWRHAHGWSQDTAADRYNRLHDEHGRAPMSGTRIGAYERWPHGGERPRLEFLRGLAEVYGTDLTRLVDEDDLSHLPEAHRLTLLELIKARSTDPKVQSEQTPTYGRNDAPTDDDPQHEVVIMAAHEGSEHAERTEWREIGEAGLERFRADVVRLSHDHMVGDPFSVFREMYAVRRRIWDALERRIWPRDAIELYFLLGVLHSLMAAAANGLGNRQAAEELVRSGWVYAQVIDHRPLMAQLRLELANIVYWERPRHSRDLALSGLRYLGDGPIAAQLHLRHGRAAARLGDADAARQAIKAAHDARDRTRPNEVLEIGGEFGLSRATQHFLAGSTLLEVSVPAAQRDAADELRQAADLYEAGPEPDEDHYHGYVMCNLIDLATVQVRDGDLDAAVFTLGPVLELPPSKRIEALLRRLHRMRPELASSRYQQEPAARELDQQIEAFTTETIVRELRELPSGRG
ncbi:hypothetical protein [Actinomadura miaoliensis]|uniref:Helix-turn-helix transcriptional regulator n=1 Tax=Actinomadura miaoliensis TaxID=430685 RepID=A0ABP7WWS0_9ACTN